MIDSTSQFRTVLQGPPGPLFVHLKPLPTRGPFPRIPGPSSPRMSLWGHRHRLPPPVRLLLTPPPAIQRRTPSAAGAKFSVTMAATMASRCFPREAFLFSDPEALQSSGRHSRVEHALCTVQRALSICSCPVSACCAAFGPGLKY